MRKRELLFVLVSALFLSILVACQEDSLSPGGEDEEVDNSTEDVATEDTIAEATAENGGDHDNAADYSWDSSDATQIVLNGNSISVEGSGASVNGSVVTITASGNYHISGSLADGQVIVDTEDENIVRLILDGVDISSASSAPIYVASAEKTMIVLADNTENYVTDSDSYVFEDPEEDEPDAAIFSKDDLTIFGNGALTVNGNYNEAIKSKDGLIIASGTIMVNSVDDGIQGKDYLIVKNGNITANVSGDGFKSNNDEDATLGYIAIENGNIQITAGGDAIQAETDVLITDGEFTLTSGGGSTNSVSEDSSAKGLKAGVSLVIESGSFSINSADDAVHSNAGITLHDGTFDISSGDDGMHADASLKIYGGDILITKSYEGLESAVITIADGDIHITSSDDGINVAGGADGSGFGRPGQGGFSSSSNYYLYINGGYIVVDADGDGLDANGSIEMNGGVVLVNGPTANNNGALDYDGSFEITAGVLVAAGSAGMVQAPGTSSTQYAVLLNFNASMPGGTLFHIESSEGEEIISFAPTKQYQSVVFSSPDLTNGTTYNVYYGGSASGAEADGLYQEGNYTPGTSYGSFTVSDIVTRINSSR
ncbi:MAG: carbohydrate-binding domain-containing protein [Cyclobacteriaceae bacterium]